jgi:5-methyltetrahydropteroyltriglutamate--homocysteine methyltransferase
MKCWICYPPKQSFPLGLVDGRNIWKNDFEAIACHHPKSKRKAWCRPRLDSPSCSLIHSPCDLKNENNNEVLTPEIKQWLAFAKQKVSEIALLKSLSTDKPGVGPIQAGREYP